jgi:uncharacterized protein with NRDE domain
MCLIAFAVGADPAVPLLIASNRDEFFDRPTAPLHRWALPNGMAVAGGRDLRDGGTWLGANAQGRVAMLTNVRSHDMGPAARSRGDLPNRWLSGEIDWPALLGGLSAADYGGFNLVVGDAVSGVWGWLSNRDPAQPHAPQTPALHSRRLPPGLYGLSNATLDTGWPKTLRLKQALSEALAQGKDVDAAKARLLSALGDTAWALDHELPQTGVPTEAERALSSPFVRIPDRAYGTRTSLLLRATLDGASEGPLGWRVQLDEWTHSDGPGAAPAWRADQHASLTLDW